MCGENVESGEKGSGKGLGTGSGRKKSQEFGQKEVKVGYLTMSETTGAAPPVPGAPRRFPKLRGYEIKRGPVARRCVCGRYFLWEPCVWLIQRKTRQRSL